MLVQFTPRTALNRAAWDSNHSKFHPHFLVNFSKLPVVRFLISTRIVEASDSRREGLWRARHRLQTASRHDRPFEDATDKDSIPENKYSLRTVTKNGIIPPVGVG